MQERIPIGLSMPKTFIAQIDSVRGDVPRSRYIQKLIEVGIAGKQQEKEKENSLAQTQMLATHRCLRWKLLLLKE
jgi:metal-responsive CopG/Arc/MetJ family transcriptional regulator